MDFLRVASSFLHRQTCLGRICCESAEVEKIQHILVLKGGAIGDFILTLPVLVALRRHFPEARLELLCRARTAPLAVISALADSWRDLDGQEATGLFVLQGEIEAPLRAWLAQFTLILCYVPDPEGVLRANLARFSSARILTGPARSNEGESRHAAEQFLDPLRVLGITDCDPTLRLDGRGKFQETKTQAPFTLAVHPGSGSEKKNWPESRWAELLRRLMDETDWNFLLIGGEAERGKAVRLAKLLPPVRCALAEQLPLADLAARLQACRFFLGHDSGITHLAAALGLPGIGLWGETNATVWRPLGGKIEILRGSGGLADLPAEKVFTELQRRVHFAPMA